MSRPWNFSAGPSTLPKPVLEQAASEMLDWHGTGISVMEMSHRSRHFCQIRDEAEADLRELLALPDDYAVLFTTGGATTENAVIPMNLMRRHKELAIDFILTGYWSIRSFKEASRYGNVKVAASGGYSIRLDGAEQQPWTWTPPVQTWSVRQNASYLHMCSNETVDGVEITEWPVSLPRLKVKIPLVVDASSNFLSRPLPITNTGITFASAQKNAGAAGLTIVLVHRDLLGYSGINCPSSLNYTNIAKFRSCYNTPPAYSIYISGLVFKWIKNNGALENMEKQNRLKSNWLYSYIDSTEFYSNSVHHASRSRTNIPFRLYRKALHEPFIRGAKEARLIQLEGHRSIGGIRASLYNALPLSGVSALIEYMKDFEYRYG